MKLEVGKTYRARNGELQIIKLYIEDSFYPFVSERGSRYLRNGTANDSCHTEFDLIGEVPEEKPVSKFKVGDTVYSIRYGTGVVEVVLGDAYPIHKIFVQFQSGLESFTEDGKEYKNDVNPTLMTLEQAWAKAYDVPKEKRKMSRAFNAYFDPVSGRFTLEDRSDIPRYTWLVKEVTFEWEE